MKFDDIEAGRIHGHVIKSDRRGGEQEIRRPILDPLPPSWDIPPSQEKPSLANPGLISASLCFLVCQPIT